MTTKGSICSLYTERSGWVGKLVYDMAARDEGIVRVYRITDYSHGHGAFALEDIATRASRYLHASSVAQLAPLGQRTVPAGQCVDLGRDRCGRTVRTWTRDDTGERWYEVILDSGALVATPADRVHLTCETGWLMQRTITVDATHLPVIVEIDVEDEDAPTEWGREDIRYAVVPDYTDASLQAVADELAEATAAEHGRRARVSVTVPLRPALYAYAAAAAPARVLLAA